MKNLLMGLLLGKNGSVSLTKTCAWLLGLTQAVSSLFPHAVPADIMGSIQGVLVALGGVGVKNAIDKTAQIGTKANPL